MAPDGDRDLIPIFPLSTVVLFPRVRTPLYIFEPRYRQMTRYALDGDGRIGMVVVLPGHLGQMQSDPPVFSIGCEGLISQHREQPDGTFHIALTGIRRFRILDEPPRDSEILFRSAEIEVLQDRILESDRGPIASLRNAVFEKLRELVEHMPEGSATAPDQKQFDGVDDETLVNAICQAIDFNASEKQSLLEANSIRERFEKLDALLRFRLASYASSNPPGSQTIH